MTDRSKFIYWLINNNKLETYILMTKVYYNHGSIKQNRLTAMEGMLELENKYNNRKI